MHPVCLQVLLLGEKKWPMDLESLNGVGQRDPRKDLLVNHQSPWRYKVRLELTPNQTN
jgi:hypothetical protein